MKLLIVEDNPSVRRILRMIVLPLAADVCECADGDEASRIYLEQNPDFVLMDINLGDFNGIAATKKIRQINPRAKIIIVTDYDEDDLRQAAAEAGASGFFLKDDLLALRWFLKTH